MQKVLELPRTISSAVAEQVALLAFSEGEDRGAVFTKPEVVHFILDAVGYKSSNALYAKSILEPCFGGGDFLLPITQRLLESYFEAGHSAAEAGTRLKTAIRAVELHKPTHDATTRKVISLLIARGLKPNDARSLTKAWFVQGDFLLTELDQLFDFVVGNPPYLRQEAIPSALLAEYRSRFATLYDRGDLYVPFFERGLTLLKIGGKNGYICSDRWMKNKYGGPLRKLISDRYRFETYVNMFGYPAFHDEVSAYTAITVISNKTPNGNMRVAFQPATELSRTSFHASLSVATGEGSWLLEEGIPVDLIRRLEAELPSIEEAGCVVGIGVATGNDSVYIGDAKTLAVEDSARVPLVMRCDLQGGQVKWSGNFVINVFEPDGYRSLENYPKMKEYFSVHEEAVRARNVSKRSTSCWYRTIDRINEPLIKKHKLLIPDIGDNPPIVHEKGKYYPHHNLYYITSDAWDLDALKALLRSRIAKLFIKAYSVKMRGGYVRYQAQYLRKIRLPRWNLLPTNLRQNLVEAGIAENDEACNALANDAYGLTDAEQKILKTIKI